MNRQIRAWFAVFVLLPVLSCAQQASPATDAVGQSGEASPAHGPVLKMRPAPKPDKGNIQLDVVVTNKEGIPVTGLVLKDFTLLDNNQPAKIVSFRESDAIAHQADDSTQVILLLDAVNLDYLILSRTRDEIAKFLRQNGGHLAQPVSVLLFSNDGAKVLLQPSTDGNALAAELDKTSATLRVIDRAGGVNGDSERLGLSIKWLTTIAENEAKLPGRKLLIWTGPGWPMLDRADITTSPRGVRLLFDWAVDVSTTLRESRVTLSDVSLPNHDPNLDANFLDTDIYESFLKGVKTANQMQSANLGLKVMAIQSGGRVMFPDNDLAAQIRRCIQDAGAFYTLSFNSPHTNQANEYHELRIVIDRHKMTARTSTGYYNQP